MKVLTKHRLRKSTRKLETPWNDIDYR